MADCTDFKSGILNMEVMKEQSLLLVLLPRWCPETIALAILSQEQH